jgi:hypothetical protein
MTEHLAVMKLRFRMPRSIWLSSFTRRHPEVLVEVHNPMTMGQANTLGEFEIRDPPIDWTREIAKSPNVIEVHRLGPLSNLGRHRVLFRQPMHLSLAHEFGLLLRYPRSV